MTALFACMPLIQLHSSFWHPLQVIHILHDAVQPMNHQPSVPQANRVFRITDMITDDVAQMCIAQLLFWQMQDPQAPVTIELDSPGGAVTATLAILDTMAFVGFPIHTRCPAYAHGCAALILSRGTKGCRSASADASIGLTPTVGGVSNSTASPEHIARFLVKIRNRIIDEFHTATGRSPEGIAQDQEHEKVFTAAEALQYGLIDRVTD